MTFEQARPSQFQGDTVLAFLGKDITYTDFTRAKSFWDGGSQAAEVTNGILQRTVDSEADSHDRGYLRVIRDQLSLWCFADLWPWLWHKNSEQAMFFLARYMNIIQPIIAVSYSRPVNAITRADFIHNNGVSMSGMSPFTEIVARPSIQFYHHADISGDRSREECAFINIPHIHPGRDKYGEQDVRLRRLLEITMQETFVIVDLTLKALAQHAKDKVPLSRLDLCKEILREHESLKQVAAYKTFSDSLDAARAQCKTYFSTSVRPSTDDVRPMLDTNGRLKLIELGRAEGSPRSNERTQQLDGLWELNKPDLHVHISNEPGNKEVRMETVMDLQTGQFLYLTALAHCEPDDYFRMVFNTFAPAGSNRTWFEDQRARGKAVLSAGLWVTRQVELNDEEQKKPRLRVHFPSEFLPASKMQNSPIGIVQSNGIARVRWKKDGDTNITIRVSSKIAIPKNAHETRVLHFTQDGLDILDAFGNPLRAIGRSGQPIDATIPRVQFGDKPDLYRLWRAVLEAENIGIPAEEDDGDDALRFDWGPAGVAALSQKAKTMSPQQNRPIPHPADANYLLYKFLDEPDFRNGGVFESLSPIDKVGAPDHVKRFVEFLQDQQWTNHPYRDWWLSNFDREKPEMAILAKNIPVFRSCKRHNKQVYSVTRKGKWNEKSQGRLQVQNTTFTIGPPGSAFDDPFDTAHGQSTAGRPATGKRAKKAGAAASVVGGDDDDEDDDEGLDKGQHAATPAPSKRRAAMGGTSKTSKKGKAADSELDEDDDDDEDLPLAPPKSKSKKSRSKVIVESDDEDEDDDDKGDGGPQRGRKKPVLQPDTEAAEQEQTRRRSPRKKE